MVQRGGDAKSELDEEKKKLLEAVAFNPSLPVKIKAGIHNLRLYGKENPEGNLDQLKEYKGRLLNYFKGKYPNKKNMTLNDFFKYERNMRAATMKGGNRKSKTRRGKKSRRVTRRRR